MAETSPYPPRTRRSPRRKYQVPATTGLRHLLVRLECACGAAAVIHEPGGRAVELDGAIHYSLHCRACGRESWMPATFHRPTVCAHLDLMNDHPSRLSSRIR